MFWLVNLFSTRMIYSTGATCSGNGIAQSTSGCGAACRCLGGWRGPWCDRTTAGGRGDPHLETLDGVRMRTTSYKAGIQQRFDAFFKKLFFKQRN